MQNFFLIRYIYIFSLFLGIQQPILADQMSTNGANRIISTANYITDILLALSLQKRIVGVDQTSQLPHQDAKNIGYQRNLSFEGMLSLSPDLILVGEEAGSDHVLSQLDQVAITTVHIPHKPYTLETLFQAIDIIAQTTQSMIPAQHLKQKIQQQYAALETHKMAENSTAQAQKKTAMLLMINGNKLHGSGSDTIADTLLGLLGVENVLRDQFYGYKPMNIESIFVKSPSLLLRADMGRKLDHKMHLSQDEIRKKLPNTCVIDIDIYYFLNYGIHIFERALMLHSFIAQEC